MATNATVYKATLQISDMDRQYYNEHGLTFARHPSETDERLMVRVLAFARYVKQVTGQASKILSNTIGKSGLKR